MISSVNTDITTSAGYNLMFSLTANSPCTQASPDILDNLPLSDRQVSNRKHRERNINKICKH